VGTLQFISSSGWNVRHRQIVVSIIILSKPGSSAIWLANSIVAIIEVVYFRNKNAYAGPNEYIL